MGIRWSLVAGRQAHDLLSFAEAVRHFDTALGLCPPDDESEEAQRAAILLAKATTQARAGRHVPALATFKAAFDSAQRAQDAQTLVDAALGYEDARWRPGLHGGPALPLLAAAEAVVDDDDVAHRARIAIGTARALMYTGDKAAADVAYERAASLVAEADDPHIEAGYLEAFLVPVVVDPPPGYLDHADRLRSLGDRTGSTEHILMAGQFRIRELLRTGRIDEAVSTHEDMTRRTQEQRSPFWNYIVATHRASLDLFEGDLDRAERSADHALEIAETLPEEDHSGVHGLQMFLVRREQDRLGVVAPLLRRLVADRPAVSMWDPGLGVFLADIGDLDTARASFERLAADDFAVNPLDAMWPAVMAFSIELALALDDPGRAALLLERVERLSGTLIIVGHDIANLGSADRFIGLAAMTAGQADVAEHHLDLAIEQNEAMGSPLWAGHSRLAKAWWLAREGDEPGARALAVAVAEAADAAGHAALVRKARAL